MTRFNCLVTFLVAMKKKSKELPKAGDSTKGSGNSDLVIPIIKEVRKEGTFDAFGTQEKGAEFTVKPADEDSFVKIVGPPEVSYEGGDEHDEIASMKRDFSDLDLQALAVEKEEPDSDELVGLDQEFDKGMASKSDRFEGITPEGIIPSGHVSDPGMDRTSTFLRSPMLKRSCSNIESKRASRLLASPTKSNSYDDLQKLSGNEGGDQPNRIWSRPQSVRSNCSADRVMLKKRSSSQVLPSRSRKVWWKLFLWSHRNLHKSRAMKPKRLASRNGASHNKDGYTSDTVEPSLLNDRKSKKPMEDPDNGNRTDFWPQNQWVAFSADSSSLDRVNAWVNSLEASSSCLINNEGNLEGEQSGNIVFPGSPGIGESSGKSPSHIGRRFMEEVVQANNIIQSLNSFSSVAHISGMGLKVVPTIAAFSSLRSVNLSGNFIVHITPGSLPKGLHMLDLSRNKIATIEGLRDLTRLRVLNLSYNRISRIGRGLSNCTLIKELYLAGNKISDLEGLHRLLKITVLDVSFNKITTANALGQLVANYNSLLALNLLGNPIQTNIGDDQIRKAVAGLLPQLAYLNKQPIKPQRVREVATDSVAKAALGNGGWSTRRRSSTRRVSQGSSPLVRGRDVAGYKGVGSGSGSGQKSGRTRSKSRHQHPSSSKK